MTLEEAIGDAMLDSMRKIYRYARALEFLEKRPLYTREFLRTINSWGDSFELLKELQRCGLIERYVGFCYNSRRKCIYNRVSEKGREFLSLIRKLVAMINDPYFVTKIR